MATRLATMYAFQVTACAGLEAAARGAGDGAGKCAAWVALQDQADRLVRNVANASTARWAEKYRDLVIAHSATVEEIRRRARANVDSFDESTRQRARAAVGIRVAVAGKGGSGKSLIASTLSRLLAQRGRHVLSVDLDTSDGLSYGLGMPSTAAGLPMEALDGDHGWATQLAPRAAALGCRRALRAAGARRGALPRHGQDHWS